MPDVALASLVAHELAHVHQFATGCDWSRPRKVVEAEADDLLKTWGFRPEARDEWSDQRAREKVQQYVDRWVGKGLEGAWRPTDGTQGAGVKA
jgi:hypothetical protein